ncbi:MAG: hypothetical protein GY724_23820 [Actinomycetia bacterium]|nr:hypothetical protein [Actinomycetes bacterium]
MTSQGDPSESGEPAALTDFDCPRCQRTTTARFYGPCDDCRRQLRADLSGQGREVEVADYEPKMNVTPNAVATKE